VGPTSAYSGGYPRQERAASPRRRRCLLKGCEAWFRSSHPLARYCSSTCSRAARRWSQWRANCRYRQSEQGKEHRRQQCQRRRERQCLKDDASGNEPGASCEREGYHKADEHEKVPCHRPGCYECFAPTARSPLKKFCSPLCRQALRRVLEREARWRRRLWQRGISIYANSVCDLKPPDLGVAY
jgi:hypothetical protein